MPAHDPLAGAAPPTTAAQQIAAVIRERILSGKLASGDPLTEARLVRAFGVSRHTVREVIRILSGQGIVTQHPFRGATVTSLTAEDIHDIYRIRRLVELPAIDESRHASAEQLASLEAALDALQAASEDDDFLAMAEADLAFHRGLASLLGSERAQRVYDQLQTELRLCLLIVDRAGREEPDSLVGEHDRHGMVAEHREILELIKAGDRRTAKKRLRETLDLGERYLTSQYAAAQPDARR